jgi:hypothetical protein
VKRANNADAVVVLVPRDRKRHLLGRAQPSLRRPSAPGRPSAPRQRYSMRMPLIAREITSCWICSVPSKMS